MIRPEKCGPLPDWAEKLLKPAEDATDRLLKNKYNPLLNIPVELYINEITKLRTCGDSRIFDEFIFRYESHGWECVWIVDKTDGMTSPHFVATGYGKLYKKPL